MITLVCAPVWGHGMATFAWVLWWMDSLLALTSCLHLTYVMLVSPFCVYFRIEATFLLLVLMEFALLTEPTECPIGEVSWRR
jgi:hypothetical protein